MTTCTESSYCIGFHAWTNQCTYVSINSHTQALSSALVIPTRRLTSTTPSVVVKVVSFTSGRLSMEGIIQLQWVYLNLRQVVI